ncbi:MAG: DUF3293 domain-containing protein [Pseudomonadota bacterium]
MPADHTGLPAALLAAYRSAVYRVHADGETVDFHIGRRSTRLAMLLEQHGARGAAFLTACNPGSTLLPEQENRAAHAALLARLGDRPYLPGIALDPAGHWPGEISVLVPGLEADEARALAAGFRQNALVWIHRDGTPELMIVAVPRAGDS